MEQITSIVRQAYLHRDGTWYGRTSTTLKGNASVIEFQLVTLGSNFVLSWRPLAAPTLHQHGQLDINGTSARVTVYVGDATGPAMQSTGSVELMVAEAQGISGGSASLTYGLWSGFLDQILPRSPWIITTVPNGVQIAGLSATGNCQVILRQGHILECHEQMTHQVTAIDPFAKMSDEQISAMLESAGLPTTAQGIANVRSNGRMFQSMSGDPSLTFNTDTIFAASPLAPLPSPAQAAAVGEVLPAPMDLTHLTATVTAARAAGTAALTSHDLQTLLAADQEVCKAVIAMMSFQMAARGRDDTGGDAAISTLDESGMNQLQRDLSKALGAVLQASIAPGTVRMPELKDP